MASRRQFHIPISFGRFVAAIAIVFIEGTFIRVVPRLDVLFRAMGVNLPSLPGWFIQTHPYICQGIAAATALTAIWALVKKRGRILAILLCCSLLQVGLVAWVITIKVPTSTLSTTRSSSH